jgi:hypothetical protein
MNLVNLFMCSDSLKENGFGALALNEPEDDSEIVPSTARLGAPKRAF